VRREFKPALARAGLEPFRFHDLRHFAVSALIAAGADIKLLQAIAGHASATTTLDTYGHLMTARVQEAATRYDPLAVRPGKRESPDPNQRRAARSASRVAPAKAASSRMRSSSSAVKSAPCDLSESWSSP